MIKWLEQNKSWKIAGIALLLFALVYGLLMDVPRTKNHESIRNLYYHVPMWFGMLIILFLSVAYSLLYLRSNKAEHDLVASEMTKVAVFYGVLGLVTGMLWAKFTWGFFWSWDPKQTCVAVAMLIYFAYLVLRASIEDEQLRARISAIYNIFALPTFIALILVVPKFTDSLHPGSNEASPAFSKYDLNANMRMVFYPAILGWTLLAIWVAVIRIKLKRMAIERQQI